MPINLSNMEKESNKKIKDWRVLEFCAPIEEVVSEETGVFLIRGIAINETTTLNNVKYVSEELQKAAMSFRDVPILLDHKNEVGSIVGRTTENVTFNPSFKRIEYEAKIMDEKIKEMIKDGRIKNVSIGAKVEDLVEEEDGSMKAIGIKGLEISIVAVPGDNQASLAQAIQQGLHLKEMAELKKEEAEIDDTKLNNTEVKMAEDEKVETPEAEAPVEAPAEEVPEEAPAEVASERAQNININMDNSDLKEQINELKELLMMKKKKIKEQAEEEEVADETKGEVSAEEPAEEAMKKLDNLIVEKAKLGYAIYKDYSQEGADSNLKRLVR